MEQGIFQLVGLACSQCSRQLRVWALTNASRQADEMAGDEQPTIQEL